MIFQCDNGSGGTTEYFRLDGGLGYSVASKDIQLTDNVNLIIGSGSDAFITHTGTVTNFLNYTGNLQITQHADNADIIFSSDNGSGGTIEYLRLDGSDERLTVNAPNGMLFFDNIKAKFGTGGDFTIHHNGTVSAINNALGHIQVFQNANDSNIEFYSDDGSGGTTEYFRVDGGTERIESSKSFRFADGARAQFGASSDMQIYHDSNDSRIENSTGDIVIQNETDDRDIKFRCDDGSGGTTEYFRLDGSSVQTIVTKNFRYVDNAKILIGTGEDLQILHDGNNSFIQNSTGQLQIIQNTADEDIIFLADGGSGSAVEYMRLDGSQVTIRMKRQVKWDDNIKATFGDSGDLEIYHDGTDSFIDDAGTGDLRIRSNFLKIEKYTGETMATFNDDNAVSLYFNNSKKLETTSSGINIQSVPEHADNSAASSAGLAVGDVYRTGDLLKIRH